MNDDELFQQGGIDALEGREPQRTELAYMNGYEHAQDEMRRVDDAQERERLYGFSDVKAVESLIATNIKLTQKVSQQAEKIENLSLKGGGQEE